MLPLRIKVKNFGAIPEADVDLAGIFLASIVGANGRGKSTIFTWAPLYALFGKTKNGCSVDDMVKTGQQDMLVQFDFEHQGSEYQVTRTRSLKGKGKSTLEFQKLVNGRYEILSGTTIAETEAKIRSLLNLDANTFVASSMILQNDASNFTQKPPGERKAILTQILGLEIYDKLQQAAREKEKALTIQLETSKNKLAELEEKLQALPEVEQQMIDIGNSITLNSLSIREKETALSDTQAVIKDLESKEQRAREIKTKMDGICTDIQLKESEIADHETKIKSANQVLESEELILTKAAELEDVKGKIPALQAKEDRITQLKTDGAKLANEEKQLLDGRDELHRKIETLEKELSARGALKKASDEYQQALTELSTLDQTAEEWQLLKDDILAAEKRVEQYGSCLNQQRTELKNYEIKAQLLETANCPVSGEANCVFLKDAIEAKKQIPIIDSDILNTEKDRMVMIDHIKEQSKQQEDLQYDKSNHVNLKKRVEQLRKQVEAYAQLSGKEELLQTIRKQKEQFQNRISAINGQATDIRLDIQKLQQDTENLPILKASIPSLEKYVAMKDKLPEARTTIQLSREAIVKLQTEIEQKIEQNQQLLTDYAALCQAYIGTLPGARQKVITIEGELKDLQVNLNNCFAIKGTYQAKLDVLTKDAEEKDRLSAELAPKAKELVRWQTLVKAFGKNGVPALIIENAIPELERISNDILSQMSNGAHSLRFETQRDLKSKDGVAETLDIIVSDWAGSRPYETYSGGEQLRIDLAIRFALAELLANRAGSKVEFIVADEIFGSQDTEHRELVIDAIKAVANRFRMILVISHISEAQAAFDQQIVLSESGKVEVLFS